ncbi:MAG TPA: DNA repair protein RecN [Pyrinomonadaceae bacterium]|nr:DNA repair protein RecN [Pyrinomonadaceae bacterium]
MLTLLKIKNIALIDSLEVEFGDGLNLLTGETGSGKSIIVDSLGALTGDRVSSDLVKEGEQSATIEGLFSLSTSTDLRSIFDESGIEIDGSELIVRRELSLSGKNRVFVNNQLVTQSFLKRVGAFLVDIHGQGEQASLFDPATHLELLDAFASVDAERARCAEAYREWSATRNELESLRRDESNKLQLLDILKFQVEEIGRAGLTTGEDAELDEEKRKLSNVEKLSTLTGDTYTLLYEQDASTLATLERAARKIDELASFDSAFADYREPLATARAVLEDLATTARDYRNSLEFSPTRLEEIENRLAEIARLTRKYGGTVESALEHLADSQQRLSNIETAEFREQQLEKKLATERIAYLQTAAALHEKRVAAATRFEKEVETSLKAVALEKAKFEVRVSEPEDDADTHFSANGFDRVEFYFSANPGESPRPLVKVASGGEASRLMLILKTTAKTSEAEKASVFDEIDTGIGGRVAESVGLKLKQLARSQQVLCVTHQPQVAALADRHFAVEKSMGRNKTRIAIRELIEEERIEEIARMLAGEKITESARTHAAEMIESGKQFIAETQRRGEKKSTARG